MKTATLSYTWGGPINHYDAAEDVLPAEDWHCPCYSIRVDGHDVSVGANLYTAPEALQLQRRQRGDVAAQAAPLPALLLDRRPAQRSARG